LFEILLVMVIMFILAAIASPLAFQALQGNTKVISAGDQIRGSWANCRYQAMDSGRPYVFSVVPNSGKYKVEPYAIDGSDPEAMIFMANVNNNGDNQGPIFEENLPEGIRFGTKERPVDPESEESTGNDYVSIAVFWPDGTAQNDVEMTFGSKEGGILTIRLNAATGSAVLVNPDHAEASK